MCVLGNGGDRGGGGGLRLRGRRDGREEVEGVI